MGCTRLITCAAALLALNLPVSHAAYEPTQESLSKHQDPEWLLDAKFGVWTHWTPITHAIREATHPMGWYGGHMYLKNFPEHRHHLKHYGKVEEVGYPAIIEDFNPVNFDAKAWAELFAASGAQFAGPTAIHHDNVAMWDSELTPWNMTNMGPKRDLVGELGEAIREQGMKYMLSYHHAFSWWLYRGAYDYEEYNDKNIQLFGEKRPDDLHEYHIAPESFQQRWLDLTNEANEKYQPDVTWFDFGLSKNTSAEFRNAMFADYYNMGEKWGKEVQVLMRDRKVAEHYGNLSMEKGVPGTLVDYSWNVVDSISEEWFAFSPKNGVNTMPLHEIVHSLVDTVSKNGTYILNIGPRADGSIREVYEKRLREVGSWLETNGEAIYGTRPWLTYGENARGFPMWRYRAIFNYVYDHRDVRYTQSKDGQTVYAITMGWPQVASLTMQSGVVTKQSADAQVRLLGHPEPVPFQVNKEGKIVLDIAGIDMSKIEPRDPAFSFAITGFEFALAENADLFSPNAVGLHPEEAGYQGRALRHGVGDSGTYITYWLTDEDAAHWQKTVRNPVKYKVVMRYSNHDEREFPLEFAFGDTVLEQTSSITKPGEVRGG